MVLVEPDSLAVVRALAGGLEEEPLAQMPFVGLVGRAELVVLIVLVNDVLDNGARLPEDKVVVVGVLDGGDAAVGVDLDELGALGVFDGNL